MEDTTVETPVHKQIQNFMHVLFREDQETDIVQLRLFIASLLNTGKPSSAYGATKHDEFFYIDSEDDDNYFGIIGATDGTKRVVSIELNGFDHFRRTVAPVGSFGATRLKHTRNYLRQLFKFITNTKNHNPRLEGFLTNYLTLTDTTDCTIRSHVDHIGDKTVTYIYWK